MHSPHSRLMASSPSHHSPQHDVQKAFKSLDHQNQGKIKKSVVLSASMYISSFYERTVIEQELQKCSEEITFEKFTQIFEMAQVQKEDNSASWIFKLYDHDQKGYIDRNDLLRASETTGIQLSEEEIGEMLHAENLMVEGKVHFDDFAEIMTRQVEFE